MVLMAKAPLPVAPLLVSPDSASTPKLACITTSADTTRLPRAVFYKRIPLGLSGEAEDGCGCGCSSGTESIATQLNLYSYVSNDPINMVDQKGLVAQVGFLVVLIPGLGEVVLTAAALTALAFALGIGLAELVALMGNNQNNPSNDIKAEVAEWVREHPEKTLANI